MKNNKTFKKWASIMTALVLGLAFYNCDDDESSSSKPTVTVTGEIAADTTWSADNDYFISGAVRVASGATLTVEAGTTVKGDPNESTVLIIDRDAQIEAIGTAAAPIIFTSAQAEGSRAAGDWGGIVINGNSTYNSASGTGDGEGSSGTFGGGSSPDTADNSGTLQYVRVEYAGQLFSTENELNGIAFQAVGSGTTVENLQVHYGKDDGVEFFGGTVDVSNVVISYAQDDSFDWTSGWTGTASNVLILFDQGTSEDPRAIEGDNDGDDNDLTPRSNPTLNNFTIIGGTDQQKNIIKIRRGSYATLDEFYIAHMCDMKIKLDNDATIDQAGSDVVMTNSLIEAVQTSDPESGDTCNFDTANLATDIADIMGGEKDDESDASAGELAPFFNGGSNTINADMSYLTFDGSETLVSSFLGSGDEGAVTGTDWTADWTDFSEN